MTKHTILFLASNLLATDRLALDEEARAIQVELERSGFRDRFELVTRWAMQPLDLLRELRKLKPTIVHVSGHRGRSKGRPTAGLRRDDINTFNAVDVDDRSGLFFHGADGETRFVSTAALEDTFVVAGSSVKLVVLNACYSNEQAMALSAHVECVVGTSSSVTDQAARSFAIGFYGGLGECESVASAYRQGCAAIRLEALHDNGNTHLRARRGVEVEQLFIVAMNSTHANKASTTSQSHHNITPIRPVMSIIEPSKLAFEFVSGKYHGAEVPLPASGVIRIGRIASLEIVLIDDTTSRFHAQVCISDGSPVITDRASTHGTFVNGGRIINATSLYLNDRIIIGTSIIRLIVSTGGTGLSLAHAATAFQQRQITAKNRSVTAPSGYPPRSGLLELIPMEDLLRVLLISLISCVVTIQTKHKRGLIRIDAGDIRGAFIEHQPMLPGEEAFMEIFAWRAGIFTISFDFDLFSPCTGTISMETEQLLKKGLMHVQSTQGYSPLLQSASLEQPFSNIRPFEEST